MSVSRTSDKQTTHSALLSLISSSATCGNKSFSVKPSRQRKTQSLLSTDTDVYLWFLAVVFVLYPIDLLQQVAHAVHLQKRKEEKKTAAKERKLSFDVSSKGETTEEEGGGEVNTHHLFLLQRLHAVASIHVLRKRAQINGRRLTQEFICMTSTQRSCICCGGWCEITSCGGSAGHTGVLLSQQGWYQLALLFSVCVHFTALTFAAPLVRNPKRTHRSSPTFSNVANRMWEWPRCSTGWENSKHVIKSCNFVRPAANGGRRTHLPPPPPQPESPWGKSLCPCQTAAERRPEKVRRRQNRRELAEEQNRPHHQPTRSGWRCVRADRTAGTLPSWSAPSQTAESCPEAGNCRKHTHTHTIQYASLQWVAAESVGGASLHLHWNTVVELLYGLVVDGDGHLRIRVKGKLNIVAGPVLHRRLLTRQLQVLAASTRGGRHFFRSGKSNVLLTCRSMRKWSERHLKMF